MGPSSERPPPGTSESVDNVDHNLSKGQHQQEDIPYSRSFPPNQHHTTPVRLESRQTRRRAMPKETFTGPLEQIDECCWRIPKSYKPGMKVDGLIFTSAKMLEQLKKDQAPEQVANVAFLPGIQSASLA